jgi:ABC-2 type transport system permease protein
VVDPVRDYLLLVRMWSRAAWQYRTSLILLTLSQTVITAMDLAMVGVLFAHVDLLGGFELPEVLFLYGTSYVAFGTADLLLGTVDLLGQRIRDGSFDTMLIRPVSTLAQVAAEDFTPRRAAGLIQGVLVLGVSLPLVDVVWTPARIGMVLVMPVAGAVIFGSIRVIFASALFLINEATDFITAFTYGGNVLNQYPLTIYGREALRILVWVVPLAFVNWLPALFVLGRTDPFGLPAVLQFASPAVAVVLAVLASVAWRTGVRHYRSTGS